tara:strand:+ start:3228 stop:3953 length:726 start_codon:yes stop_codon:yes gene_type:complete
MSHSNPKLYVYISRGKLEENFGQYLKKYDNFALVMNVHLITELTHRLEMDLPGIMAQKNMMSYPYDIFRPRDPDLDFIPASVLILLFPQNDSWHFFLTKRSESVDHHKGQISLPGGVIEKGESKKEAAIRETNEEIGIKPESISIIGSLTPFKIPVSRFKVFPYIGWVIKKPETKLQHDEVEYIFSVPVLALIDKKNEKNKKEELEGKIRTVPYFHLNNEIVWGATSIILSEFKSVLEEII